MNLTPRFEQALQYACVIHAGQRRKVKQVPYVAHLLAVTAIALEHGADEDQAIAALLHDAAEDAGGRQRLEDIRARFGQPVAEIVAGCSDCFELPKPPWRQRKQAYVEHARTAAPHVCLVSAADKLHNVQSIVADYHAMGEQLWDLFGGSKQDVLWYYQELLRAFRDRAPAALIYQLEQAVGELERIVTSGGPVPAASPPPTS